VGCETAREWTITGRLWNGEDARRFSDPAPHPNVQLSQWRRTGDILVQYDAITGRSEQIKRRAFLLEENRLRLENHQKLVFLDNVADADLTNIPRCNHGSFEASTNYPCYSMIDDERGFYLFRSDETPHEWRLPIYQESSGKWRNLAWTPIAVAGDCTILGLIAGALWVKWGGPGLAN
jgi:hypothetical protein